MNLLGPDHRTSHATVQSLACLAAGRVSRLNKDIFLLIRPSVVCPPRRCCTCSSQCLMYVFSSSSIRSVSQLSLTVFLLLHMTPPNHHPTPPPRPRLLSPPSSQLLIIGCRSKGGASKSIEIPSLARSHLHMCSLTVAAQTITLCSSRCTNMSPCQGYLLFMLLF